MSGRLTNLMRLSMVLSRVSIAPMAASLDILLGEVFSCFAASFMVTHCSGCSDMDLVSFSLISDILPCGDGKCNDLQ